MANYVEAELYTFVGTREQLGMQHTDRDFNLN